MAMRPRLSQTPPVGVFHAVEQTDRERADSFVEQVLKRRTGHHSMIPKKLAPNVIRGGFRFSEKIML
jgi:hypothetical protein